MVAQSEKIDEENEVLIWKVLADPTRRKLMDLIREAPKTTSDLVAEFQTIGRCAVMKHLSMLESSSLISIRRSGKYRWNHINAVPLQQIYERWVKKYEVQWATNLIQIKDQAENSSKIENEKKYTNMESTVNTINIRMEIPIKATIQDTWDCLINDVGLWWNKGFYTSQKTKNFIIEPVVGGRMFEDYGNNEGLLWANVIVLDSPTVIEFKGHLTPEFGGPAISFLKLKLEETDNGTLLILTDSIMGNVSEKSQTDLAAGWKVLFEEGFKQYTSEKFSG